MSMRRSIQIFIVLLSVLIVGFTACHRLRKTSDIPLQLIPKPASVVAYADSLDTSGGFNIISNLIPEEVREKLQSYLSDTSLKVDKKGIALRLVMLDELKDSLATNESYSLKINHKGVAIYSSSEQGLFYGIQTLLQLTESSEKIPFLEIEDSPEFAYRGLHIDVSRHFFSLNFLKKQIDMMAYYKLNRLHWHLTDGPGWRIEIKKYPELTNIAAWRTHHQWKEWWASGRKYVKEGTAGAYGGYYTQNEARELVRYAAERHITIIPEIEMPGHSEEVLAVYPQLACTEKPYTSSEFCIGNNDTFTFLENVLSEIVDIFPSEYIHIGGDEADKAHWMKCPKCQARIKKEGLKDEAELQSYLIRRIEKFLHSKGRKLIGWDEILEGGLDKSAVVMAWRDEKIGIEAAQKEHKVIMTPGKFCYFDNYQGIPDTQPEAIGGFLPVEKVYSYNPVPDSLSQEIAARIWGIQGNVWSEYISTEKHAEYMIYPRLLALAEVAWSKPENKSWEDFKPRLNHAIRNLTDKGYNTYTLSKEPFVSLDNDTVNKKIVVKLSSELYPAEIRYTTDGTPPNPNSNLYESPIYITDSAHIGAQLFRNGEALGSINRCTINYHHAIGKTVNYLTPYSSSYPASGKTALIDGMPGGLTHGDGYWQGFNGQEMDVVIDMHKNLPIRNINLNFMQNGNAWIWFPKTVIILISDDGEEYRKIALIPNKIARDKAGVLFQNFRWDGSENARYIRVKALANGGWLFADEVVVW